MMFVLKILLLPLALAGLFIAAILSLPFMLVAMALVCVREAEKGEWLLSHCPLYLLFDYMAT